MLFYKKFPLKLSGKWFSGTQENALISAIKGEQVGTLVHN
jgi:hypothetical protein